MSFPAAAAILIGLLCLVNLVLLLGLIRRQHEHTELLSRLVNGQPATQSMLAPGLRPGKFGATTVDGEPVAVQDLTLVGFLTQDCRRCQERLPLFVQAAKAIPEGRRRVLAVVVVGAEIAHPDNLASSHLARLSEIAQVVVEQRDGPISSVFRVAGFPSFYRLDPDGVVVAHGDEALTVVSARAVSRQPSAQPAR